MTTKANGKTDVVPAWDWDWTEAKKNNPAAPVAFAEFAQQNDSREILVDGILATQSFVLVAGKPMSGKSWLAMALAVALATGTSFLDKFAVPKRRRVLLVDQDTPSETLRERLVSMMPPEASHENLHVLSQQGLELDTKEGIKKLLSAMKNARASVVIIDSLAASVSSEFRENDADSVRKLLKTHLRQSHIFPIFRKCTFVLLHHLRKGGDSDDLDGVRGSGAVVAEADAVFLVFPFKDRGHFVVRPVWKRFDLGTTPFLAGVEEQEGERRHVRFLRECFGTDPEEEEQLQHLIMLVACSGEAGITVKEVIAQTHLYYTQRQARRLLDLARERGLLIRRNEAHNRYRFFLREEGTEEVENWEN
jgi:predicted ATP-dependent serine protease